MEEDLQRLVEDFLTQKQILLVQVKKGILSKEQFLREVLKHIEQNYHLPVEKQADLLKEFEQYVFGYSRLSPLMDDGSISDIRVVSHDCIRIKREGKRMDAGIAFASEKEYRQFIDYIATRNQVNISNLNAIQRFTDTESHPDFIFRFTLSMPIVNTYSEPYLCIRKVPKNFPMMAQLVEKNMMDRATAELLVQRFRQGSTLICGGNSSGKTTLLNALKETLPDDMAILVAQQADELTTLFHPDMMFLHSLPGASESSVNYDLKHISIAGLTMDDRLCICNMAIEAGAKNGIFPVDEVTKAYLKGRSQREPVYYEADPDAEYEKTIEIDLDKLEPTVSYPHLPENTHPASEGKDIRIDQVVIGSCTNGRLEDMEAAYNILKGKHIAKGVRGIIIPATMAVYKECILRGWTEAFIDAGCIVSTPTCGPCLGGYMGILAEGERCVSTTNRNFVGRMGHVKSEVYLASPATAAASALTGYITDPRTV